MSQQSKTSVHPAILAVCVAFAAVLFAPPSPSQEKAQPQSAGKREVSAEIPVSEIIRRFAAKESEFRIARGEYTYTQDMMLKEINPSGSVAGEFRQISEVVFTPEGKRFERITFAPPSTLPNLSVSNEDLKDLENIQPFVLTTEDLYKYDITFEGREQVDELGTYVFNVRPKRLEKGERYFQGTIWVDDQDLQIVKTRGKAVPDDRRGKENLFPTFETYREQIDGNYWFPTLTRADDVLKFTSGDIHIRLSVRYQKYKRFGSTIRIIPVDPEKKPPESR